MGCIELSKEVYVGRISRCGVPERRVLYLISKFACEARGPKNSQPYSHCDGEGLIAVRARRADNGFFEFECRMQISLQSILQRPSAVQCTRAAQHNRITREHICATALYESEREREGGVQQSIVGAQLCASTKTQLRKRSRCVRVAGPIFGHKAANNGHLV